MNDWKKPEERLPSENCFVVAMIKGEEIERPRMLYYYAKYGHFVGAHKNWSDKVIAYIPVRPFHESM